MLKNNNGLITSSFGGGAFGGGAPMMVTDSAVAQGMTFLESELEKRDPRLYEPLTSVTWARDIVANTGGGWSDFSSMIDVEYASSGSNQYGIVGSKTTDVPVMQANLNKTTFKVFTWSNKMLISYVDMMKTQAIGRALDDIYDNGIRLNYNKTLDQAVYLGFDEYGTEGLINNSNVTSSLALANGTSSSRLFSAKSADQILQEINALITRCWARAEYDTSAIPNTIGLPPEIFSDLNTRLVSTAGNISILEYLLRNNIARTQGVDLQIVPMRQLIGVGTPLTSGGAATNRVIAYVNKEEYLSIDLPVPLYRALTQNSVSDSGYLSQYFAQVGEVKFKYFQPVEYLDGV